MKPGLSERETEGRWAGGSVRRPLQGLLRHVRPLLWHLLLIAVGITMALPLVWMLSTSLKGPGSLLEEFLPRTMTLRHYHRVLAELPYFRFYLNSFLIAAVVTVGQVFTSSLTAYAFARIRFPARDRIFLA